MAKATSGRSRRPPSARRQASKQVGAKKPAALPRKKKSRTPAPDDQLDRAVNLAQIGKVKQAFKAAEAILAAHPDHWRTLNFLSFLLARTDQNEAALVFAERALAHAPDDAETHRLLTLHCLACADKAGRPEAAISICRQFLDRYEPSPEIFAILSNMQILVDRPSEALRTTDQGIALFPGNSTFHRNRSTALLELGRGEEAVEAFGRTLRPLPDDPGEAPAGVVSQYAAMAEGYDDNRLHQSYGRMMAQTIVKTVGATAGKRILDAGCGTGSLGTHIQAAHLVGIDLSPDMLAKAREKNLYQDLIEGDLVAVMAQRADRFDIVAATVVLYYMADLAPFFRQSARLLVPGGYLFFSTDSAPDSMEIGVSGEGEYAHSRAYVRRLAAATGFTEIAVRIMAHRGNPGFWWAFRREASS